MTVTPSASRLVHSGDRGWIVLILFGAFVLAFLIGLAKGWIRMSPSGRRGAVGRAAIGLDATLSPRGRREALDYLLEDEHRVVLEQESGDDDGDEPRIVFEYPGEDDAGPRSPD